MANIYSLQLLRNGSIFPNYEAAVTAITGSTVQDGVIKLARYKGASTDSGNTKYSTDVVKTVFGIYAAMEGNSGWTLFDSYHEIIADLQRQIDAMGGESGSIRDQILAEIAKLDYSDYVTGDSKVVTSVTETDGVVAAAGENIANIKLADYTKGEDASKVAATDTLGEALSKLEKQVEVVSANTANVISGLDYSDSAVEGEYVSQVTETDGVINVTRVALPTVAPISEAGKPIVAVSETKGAVSAATGTINAEFVNVADADNNFTASTVETVLAEIKSGYTAADQALKTEILGGASASADTLGELETLINNLGADAATYTVKKVTTGLATNVKEQYVLVETKNGESTDKEVAIPIYKDNTLKSVELVNQALQFTYIVDSGESVVSVDVSITLTAAVTNQTQLCASLPKPLTAVRTVADQFETTYKRPLRFILGTSGMLDIRLGEAGTYYHHFKENAPFFIDYAFTDIPIKEYCLLPWDRELSDHVGQMIEI